MNRGTGNFQASHMLIYTDGRHGKTVFSLFSLHLFHTITELMKLEIKLPLMHSFGLELYYLAVWC